MLPESWKRRSLTRARARDYVGEDVEWYNAEVDYDYEHEL